MTLKWRYLVGTLLFAWMCTLAPGQGWAQEESATGRKVVTRIAPQYPNLARSMNIKGSVKVEAVIAPDGSAKSVEIKGGHPVLAQSAVNAVRQWKWEPATHESHELIEIKFTP